MLYGRIGVSMWYKKNKINQFHKIVILQAEKGIFYKVKLKRKKTQYILLYIRKFI